MNKFRLLFIIYICSFLSSCWIPEKFVAGITVKKDGSYSFSYEGTLTFALALEAANKGNLSTKDEIKLQKGAFEMKEEPGFKKVEYIGNGRYEVLVKKEYDAEQKSYFLSKKLNYFTVTPRHDGTLFITAEKLSKKDIRTLRKLGANVRGKLTVSIEKGVEVIDHNADSKPKFFGLFGDYIWDINSFESKPYMVLKPKSEKTAYIDSKKELYLNKHPNICKQNPPPDWDEPYIGEFKATTNLKIRKSPSTRGRKVGVIKKGHKVVAYDCEKFEVISDDVFGYWMSIGTVKEPTIYGYAFSYYLY